MFKPIRLAQNHFDLLPYYLLAFTFSSEVKSQILDSVYEQSLRLKACDIYKQQERNKEKLKLHLLKTEIKRRLA